MNLVELKKMKISELTEMAKEFKIEGAFRPRRSVGSTSEKATP